MFGTKKDGARPSLDIDTLFGARTSVRGDIQFSGCLKIEGNISGLISSDAGDAMLILSDKGSIEGEIRVPHVVINGSVRGDIIAAERVELAAQARVQGNIYYKVLEMQAGAQVNGQVIRQDEPRKLLPKLEAEAMSEAAPEGVLVLEEDHARETPHHRARGESRSKGDAQSRLEAKRQ
jgi:cytoskeletal protein CcmA (bactofilin family)